MECDSRTRFPNVCVGFATVMYPFGEATSFHCYPCTIEIEKDKTPDLPEFKVMEGERDRYYQQRAAVERAKPQDLR